MQPSPPCPCSKWRRGETTPSSAKYSKNRAVFCRIFSFLFLKFLYLALLGVRELIKNRAKRILFVSGIKYFMATCGKQNCDTVCSSFGLQCSSTGQSFPNDSALSIFESLGITCQTNNSTDVYFYKDQPNYITNSSEDSNKAWVGRCTSKGDFGLRMLQIAQSFFEILLFL